MTSKRRSCQASSHQGCRVAPRGTTVFRLFKASPIPHGLNFDTYQFRIMSAVVETSSPHLRVSAAKTSDQTQPESTRIQAPDALVDDHFFWTYTEEPHRSRRQAIIKAHPEVRDPVCGPSWWYGGSMKIPCGVPGYIWPLYWATDSLNECNCNADS